METKVIYEELPEKYEYKIISFTNKVETDIEKQMNKLGIDGWELVSVRDNLCYNITNENKIYTIWKRRCKQYQIK